VVHEITASL